ncbi:hypothetical protein LCGC14_2126450 [marine sediment metagenome]|uniref:Fibronectin type-III domain-containing protein n=1 Tax=marine sediment metagenome TaxID=412755 RepID=A0A0F9GFU3_9ZZZZ
MKRRWLLIVGLAVALIVSVGLEARAQTTRTVELAWDASPTAGVSYNVYRSEVVGGCALVPPDVTCTKLNPTPVLVLTFTNLAVPVNSIHFYTVKAVRNTIESVPSNEVVVDLTAPAPPSNLRLIAILLAGLGLLLLLFFWRRHERN